MSAQASAFDRLAPLYGETWSDTPVGRLQRQAYLRSVIPLFHQHQSVLDLGCGTGDDALELSRAGLRVTGIDSSAEMVRIACDRGIDACQMRIERMADLGRRFDGVVSNFGALNCVERLTDLREPLAEMIRPRGWMALCLLNRVCVWETIWHAGRGEFQKAIRRWSGEARGLGMQVHYPGARDVAASFFPQFRLVRRVGIGVAVPPSYVKRLPDRILHRLAGVDRALASAPGFRALGDHQLFLFRRV